MSGRRFTELVAFGLLTLVWLVRPAHPGEGCCGPKKQGAAPALPSAPLAPAPLDRSALGPYGDAPLPGAGNAAAPTPETAPPPMIPVPSPAGIPGTASPVSPPIMAPGPVPAYRVIYRHCACSPWLVYRVCHCHQQAHHIAHRLRHQGYQAQVLR